MTRRTVLALLAALGAMRAGAAPPVPTMDVSRLDNGATLIVLPDPEATTVAVVASVRIDPADEGGEPGIAALTTRLLGADAEGRTGLLLQNEIDRFGVFGASYDGAAIVAWTASAPSEWQAAASTLLLDAIARPRFGDEAVDAARESLRREMALRRDHPLTETLRLLKARAQGGATPLAGTDESVRALTPERLRLFHARYFRPGRTRIVVAGKIEVEEARQVVAACLNAGGWKELDPAPPLPAAVAPPPIPARLRDLPVPRRAPATIVARGWLAPGLGSETARADYAALQVLDTMLGGGKGCRLFSLRDRRSLAYEVRSALLPARDATLWAAYLIGDMPTEAVTAGLTSEIEDLVSGKRPLTDAELVRAKALLKGQHALQQQRLLARARAVAWADAVGLGPEFETAFDARVEAVTLADVRRLAQALFAGASATVYTLSPATP